VRCGKNAAGSFFAGAKISWEHLEMKSAADEQRFKTLAAERAVTLIEDGMVVGLGTGSTACLILEPLSKRIREGLRILGIPTSERTAEQARALGIPLGTLADCTRVDLTIDGADEVETGTLNVIKGLGGALLREKIVASASARLVIVVDESKLVERLGRGVVPVEVVSFGWQSTARKIEALNGRASLRLGPDGDAFVTDGGHYIQDCGFGPITSADSLDRELNSIVGVVEHGLFLDMATQVIVGGPEGVRVLDRSGADGRA
jgi:ribose 5-phosphate isomerase A